MAKKNEKNGIAKDATNVIPCVINTGHNESPLFPGKIGLREEKCNDHH